MSQSPDHDIDVLAGHAARLAGVPLAELFQREPGRIDWLAGTIGPLHVDCAKQPVDAGAWQALLGHVHRLGLEPARAALLGGARVNATEDRPALHALLRTPPDEVPPALRAQGEAIAATLARIDALVSMLRTTPGDHGLPAVADVVSVGIGGSELGPRLACEALAGQAGGPRVHFLANVDGGRLAHACATLDPATAVVVLVSKSFGTQETLLNGRVLRDWLVAALGREAAGRRLFAVTANVPAAQAFGVPADQVLPMWDFVGGRFSLWSAAGLPVALALGMDGFRGLLAGAAQVDRHFRDAPLADNLPVRLALLAWWNRVWLGRGSHCVVPYDDRLAAFPGWLQQLEMESNGKRVTAQGEPVTLPTVPVIWGSVGANAQHAYFQALHQGTDVVPVDFIGVVRPDHDLHGNHQALLANLLAQGAALMAGRDRASARALLAGEADPARRELLAAQTSFPGDRPSNTLLLDRLTPEALGALLALYEHKTFVYALLCGINPFDQWGVELGKSLAAKLAPVLAGGEPGDGLDASTRALAAHVRARFAPPPGRPG